MTIALRMPDTSPADPRGTTSARLTDGRDAAPSGQGFAGTLAQLGGAAPSASSEVAMTSPPSSMPTRTSLAQQSLAIMTQASSLTAAAASVIPASQRQGIDSADAARTFTQDVAAAAKPAATGPETTPSAGDATDANKEGNDSGALTALDPALLAMAIAASGALPAGASNVQTGAAPAASTASAVSTILSTARQRDILSSAPALGDRGTTNEESAASAGLPLVTTTSLVTHMDATSVRDPRSAGSAATPPGVPGNDASAAPPDTKPAGASSALSSSEASAPHANAPAGATSASDIAKSALPHKSEADTPVFVMPASLTPSQAVARAVAVAVPSAMAGNVPDAPQPASVAPPRTMTLQLTPQSLGTVSVTMHLASGGLDLTVSASDAATGATIRRDKDALAAAVQDQGYDLRSLTVHGADAAASDLGASTRQDGGGSQAFSQAGDGSHGAGRDNTQTGGGRPGQDAREPLKSSGTSHDDAPRASAAGTLYI